MTLNDISIPVHINLDELPTSYKQLYTSGLLRKVKENTMITKENLLKALKEKFCDKNCDCTNCMGKEPYDMRCTIHLEDVIKFIEGYDEEIEYGSNGK